jgi:hypothetical protein
MIFDKYEIPFKNESGEQIPAYGVFKVTETVNVTGHGPILKAEKPDTYGSQYIHFVNGPQPVEDTKIGYCANPSQPIFAKYDDADTPANAELWGPDSSFDLKKDVGGFQIIGGAVSGRVLVVQAPMVIFLGKTDASHDKGASGTVSVWDGVLGSETDTTKNITGVENHFADLATTKFILAAYRGKEDWMGAAAEC